MKTRLPIQLCALLTLPLGAAFAQDAPPGDHAAPREVRRVMSAPAVPARPALPVDAQRERVAQRGQIGVYLGGGAAEAKGARINALVDGGPAELSGLQAGDRILAIDEQRVATSRELIEYVKSKRAGDTVRLLVDRDGWRKRLEVQLQASQPSPQSAPQVESPRRFELRELEGDPHGLHEIEELHELEGAVELEELRKLIDDNDSDEHRVHVERRDRELRFERAERLRRMQETERLRRAERERQVRQDSGPARARVELEQLRSELDALRREVDALRRELNQRRER